jgi:hypothetical protein
LGVGVARYVMLPKPRTEINIMFKLSFMKKTRRKGISVLLMLMRMNWKCLLTWRKVKQLRLEGLMLKRVWGYKLKLKNHQYLIKIEINWLGI